METMTVTVTYREAGYFDVDLDVDRLIQLSLHADDIYPIVRRWINNHRYSQLETAEPGDIYTLTLSEDEDGWRVESCEFNF